LQVERLEDRNLPSNQTYVQTLYLDLLRRPADSAGLAFWTGMLDQGTSRLQVVQGIENTTEGLTLSIQAIYRDILGRTAEPAAVSFGLNLLRTGGTTEQLQAIVLSSPEFTATGGGTTTGLVNALYVQLFDHGPDSAGLTFWSNALNSGQSVGSVALAMIHSLEFSQQSVRLEYQHLLGRAADPAGLAFWTNQLQQGITEPFVRAEILASDEVFNSPPPMQGGPPA
jgi:hypothetical protein